MFYNNLWVYNVHTSIKEINNNKFVFIKWLMPYYFIVKTWEQFCHFMHRLQDYRRNFPYQPVNAFLRLKTRFVVPYFMQFHHNNMNINDNNKCLVTRTELKKSIYIYWRWNNGEVKGLHIYKQENGFFSQRGTQNRFLVRKRD